MREISPAVGISVDDYVKLLPSELRSVVEEIRRQKRHGARSRRQFFLIHQFDLTEAEQYLADEFATK
jgi:hypothetical protein